MSELVSMKDQSEEISMKHDDDCSRGDNVVLDNNNYKTALDDEVEQSVMSFQDCQDVEMQSEVNADEAEKSKDEVTAENLSIPSDQVSDDCPSESSINVAPSSVGPKTPRPLTFSIDRIMATGNEEIGRKGDEVVSGEGSRRDVRQRGDVVRQWTSAGASAAHRFDGEPGSPASSSWLSRLQREMGELQRLACSETRRHQQQVNLPDWRSSSYLSALISRISPHLFYRQLQSSWLDAARYASLAATSSRTSGISQRLQLQQAAMLPGRLAWRPSDSEHRHPVQTPYADPIRSTAEKSNGDDHRQNSTAASRPSRGKATAETPKYADSGALDLSRRSGGHPNGTPDVLETTSSKNKADQKQPDAKMWMPVVDLKNSLEKIVNQDLEKPAKQVSCPICCKMFNAHYNLTRHMPVHTGARPFVCKVRPLFICTRHAHLVITLTHLQPTFCPSHDPTYHLAPRVPFALLFRMSGTVSFLMSAHVLLSQHSVNI